jgi:hypothetical protein
VRRWIAIGIVLMVIAPGCDRPKVQTSGAASVGPATAPAPRVVVAPLPASEPAAAVDNTPDSCVMIINQQPVDFPPARLRVKETDGNVVAFLYSDDPKDALNDDYRGNGFYFKMNLDVPDVNFDRATWMHRSESNERMDSPYGIFLNGHRRQLQPLNVRVRFMPSASGPIKVEMAGTFLSVDPQDELAATQVVPVAAWLLAEKR